MDKRQKQLIDTYIRKRSIASWDSDHYPRTLKELQYMQANGYDLGNTSYVEGILLDPSQFNQKYLGIRDLSFILLHRPELIDRSDVSGLPTTNKVNILVKYPQYFDQFNAHNFAGYEIATILSAQPELVGKFTKQELAELDAYDVINALSEQPTLITYLNVGKLGSYEKAELLMGRPELINKFYVSDISSYAVVRLLIKHPHLYRYFSHLKFDYATTIDLLENQPLLMNEINFDTYHNYELSYILKAIPKVINRISYEKAKELSYILQDIVVTNPDILNEPAMKKFMGIFNDYTIASMIEQIPKYANYFDISKLDTHDIRSIIITAPEVLKYKKFRSALSLLYSWEVDDIIAKNPKLAPYFDKLPNK